MRWRASDQEVDQRGLGDRLCKKFDKHVNRIVLANLYITTVLADSISV